MIHACKLLELEQTVHECKRCELSGKMNPYPFSQYLNFGALKEVKFLFVGRNPGVEHEYVSSDFFSYRQAYHDNFLKSNFGEHLLNAVGLEVLNRDSVFTNAVKCPTPLNIEPTLSQYKSCVATHLLHQFDILNPKKIFVFGKSIVRALAFVLGEMGYPLVYGCYRSHFSKVTIVGKDGLPYKELTALYHPAYFQRGGSKDIAKRQMELLMEECK